MKTLPHSIGFLGLSLVLFANPALAQTKLHPAKKKVPNGLFAQAESQIAVRGHELAWIQIRLVGRRVAPASSGRRSGVLVEVRAGNQESSSGSDFSPAVYLEQGVATDFPLTFVDNKRVRNATATLKVLSITNREVMIEYLQRGETYTMH